MHSRPSARTLNPQRDDPLPQRTDADLLRAWTAAHSEPAFRELVRRHAGLVLATARRRLGVDSPLADDAAQQVFIALARKPSRALRSPSLGAWLHRAAAYEAGNLLRGEVRHQARALASTSAIPLADPAGHPAPLPEAWLDALPFLDAALASLPEQDRALLILHHIEGLSYPEAADRLGCTSAAAQRRGHRALEKLSTQLRRRGVLVPAATLALGLSPALAPPTASAAMASRAVSAGGAVGGGAGLLAALFTAPVLGVASAVVTFSAIFLIVRHVQNKKAPNSPTVALVSPPPRTSPLDRPLPPPFPAQPGLQAPLPDEKLTGNQLISSTTATPAPRTSPLPPAPSPQTMKIGIVDMKRLFQEYHKTKDAETKVNEDKSKAKQELDERGAKYRDLVTQWNGIENLLKDKLVNESLKGQKQQEAREVISEARALERDMEEFRRRRETQLQEQVTRMRKGLLEDIRSCVEDKAKRDNYDLVFDKSGMSPSGVPFLLHSKDAVDFSSEVIADLNQNATPGESTENGHNRHAKGPASQ